MGMEHIGSRPSNLERVFEFEDLTFRKYIGITDRSATSIDGLTELGLGMAEHPHPLVQYAAGWALGEAGLFRFRSRESVSVRAGISNADVESRHTRLDLAERLWSKSAEGFSRMEMMDVTDEAKADVFGMEYRARQAVAYMSNMTLIARWFAGEKIDDEALCTGAAETVGNVRRLGVLMLRVPDSSYKIITGKNSFAHELTCGVLLQEADPTRCLVMPASLRRDHHALSGQRSDIATVLASKSHRITNIQVSTHPKAERIYGDVLEINARDSLSLPGNHNPRNTLEIITDTNRRRDPMVVKQLRCLSDGLLEGVIAFATLRRQRRAQDARPYF